MGRAKDAKGYSYSVITAKKQKQGVRGRSQESRVCIPWSQMARQSTNKSALVSPAATNDVSVLDQLPFSSGPVSESLDAVSSSHSDATSRPTTLAPGFDLQFDNVYTHGKCDSHRAFPI